MTTHRLYAMPFAEAPALHPNRSMITGVICGVRVEEIEDPPVATMTGGICDDLVERGMLQARPCTAWKFVHGAAGQGRRATIAGKG